uniref:rRNA methyltransferase YlbH n=2 Tax=Chenopodium quinoa TaxID=63459 RepID=A0A803LSY2_CHEQI
ASSPNLPPILSPLQLKTPLNPNSCSILSPFFKITPKFTPTNCRRSSVIVSSSGSKDAISSQEKQELFDRYGLDPNDFISEPVKRSRRKEREQGVGKGKGKQLVVKEDRKPPRTTHKLLQVLAGKAKRKKLLSPVGMDVRPMMEVVKGAAFDILQVAGGCPASLRPGRWLDLYSGTGSVGIEALSRGCSEVHFIEMDPWVVSNVLQPNLQWTGFLDSSVIHTVTVENFLERAQQFVGGDTTFDYISVTPPYMKVDYGILMNQLSDSPLVGEDAFIVVEYPLGTDMLDSCGCLMKIADRRFGRTHLAIYGPKWAMKKKKG